MRNCTLLLIHPQPSGATLGPRIKWTIRVTSQLGPVRPREGKTFTSRSLRERSPGKGPQGAPCVTLSKSPGLSASVSHHDMEMSSSLTSQGHRKDPVGTWHTAGAP